MECCMLKVQTRASSKQFFQMNTELQKTHDVVKVARCKTPPNELCLTLVSLIFCTPFSALHSFVRNHATHFSMFFSSSKKVKKFYVVFFHQCIGPLILHSRHRIWTHDLACRKYSTNHWHTYMPFHLRNVLTGWRLHIKTTLVGH